MLPLLTIASICGLGGIIRDFNWDILASSSSRAEHAQTTEVVEALALKKTMFICADMGFHFMIFLGQLSECCKYGQLQLWLIHNSQIDYFLYSAFFSDLS